MVNSPMYETLKMEFSWYWVRSDQLRQYVVLGVLTQAEFEDITGETYKSSLP